MPIRRKKQETSPGRRAPRAFRHTICTAGILALVGVAPLARAQSLRDALDQSTFQGMIGIINFNYLNHAHVNNDTHAFALGGHLIAHTGSFDGFSVGVGGYTAQSLNIYDKNHAAHYDGELTGQYFGIQSIRQAYLQFQTPKVEIRAGRQLIQTPYANQDYYTFNPRAFMGVAGVVNVLGEGNDKVDTGALTLDNDPAVFSIFATRMINYESRYSSAFTAANRYSGSRPTNGFIAFGARYHGDIGSTLLTAQAWYYDFYQYAQMVYGQVDLVQPVGHHQAIFGSVQALSEGNSAGNSQRIMDFTNGNANAVNAHIYGAKLGFSTRNVSLALVGDYSPIDYGSFRHGGMIHPYNDLTGTSFTDTMQTGISDFGPGYAYGITSHFAFLRNKLKVGISYIRYLVRYGYGGSVYSYTGNYGFPTGQYIPNQQLWALDAGASYDLSSVLKGLSIAEDTDIAEAQNRAGYAQNYQNPYFSSRFYLEYKF